MRFDVACRSSRRAEHATTREIVPSGRGRRPANIRIRVVEGGKSEGRPPASPTDPGRRFGDSNTGEPSEGDAGEASIATRTLAAADAWGLAADGSPVPSKLSKGSMTIQTVNPVTPELRRRGRVDDEQFGCTDHFLDGGAIGLHELDGGYEDSRSFTPGKYGSGPPGVPNKPWPEESGPHQLHGSDWKEAVGWISPANLG